MPWIQFLPGSAIRFLAAKPGAHEALADGRRPVLLVVGLVVVVRVVRAAPPAHVPALGMTPRIDYGLSLSGTCHFNLLMQRSVMTDLVPETVTNLLRCAFL